ncbi:MAG TPA: alpha/beta hydrolase [Lacunisphaera sp.]
MRRLITALWLGACLQAAGHAQEETTAATAKVETPLTLPGAESFIYHDVPPEPMRLHVFKPKGWSAADQRPAFIHFFGGGFVRGVPTQSAGWARQAATLGMIGVAADYRVLTRHGTDGTACLADARAAVRWLQVHAAELGLDPKRIVVSGSSAGGGLALWTAITASPPGSAPEEAPLHKPAALILMWPAADFTLFSAQKDRFGGHRLACSATQHLDAQMPPSLLLHGDKDPTVPYESSVILHRTLVGTGNSCEFITMPGCGHGTTLPEWKAKLPDLIRRFLTAQKILPVP